MSVVCTAIVSPTQIRYSVTPETRLESMDQVHVRLDGKDVAIESVSSIGNNVTNGVITLAEPLDLARTYTVEIDGKTYPLFKLDTSSESHPFYTGAQTRIVEAGRVEKFRNKYAKALGTKAK